RDQRVADHNIGSSRGLAGEYERIIVARNEFEGRRRRIGGDGDRVAPSGTGRMSQAIHRIRRFRASGVVGGEVDIHVGTVAGDGCLNTTGNTFFIVSCHSRGAGRIRGGGRKGRGRVARIKLPSHRSSRAAVAAAAGTDLAQFCGVVAGGGCPSQQRRVLNGTGGRVENLTARVARINIRQ